MVGYAGDPYFDLASEIARRVPGGIRALVAGEIPGAVPDGPLPTLAPARVPSVDQLKVPAEANPPFPPASAWPARPEMEDPRRFDVPQPQSSGIAEALTALAGRARPPMPNTTAPPYPAVVPEPPGAAAPAEGDGGLLGRFLPEGVRHPIVDALSALGHGDPNASPMQAFGQGFGGAQASRQAREDRKDALTASAEEKSYQRGRDTLGDTRNAAADAREERKMESAERAAQIDEISTAAGIEHTRAETRKIEAEYSRAGLTVAQLQDIEDDVIAFGKTFVPSGQLDAPDEKQQKVVKDAMNAYRTERIQALGGGDNAGASSTVEKGALGGGGDGRSIDSPIAIPPGADYRGTVEKLAPGTFFIGPDGKPWEKH